MLRRTRGRWRAAQAAAAATISDGVTTDTASLDVCIARPTRAPVTSLVSNSIIGSTVPLEVSWCGVTASPTAVRGYTVQQSSTGGGTLTSGS
jgi:hypothetical protein